MSFNLLSFMITEQVDASLSMYSVYFEPLSNGCDSCSNKLVYSDIAVVCPLKGFSYTKFCIISFTWNILVWNRMLLLYKIGTHVWLSFMQPFLRSKSLCETMTVQNTLVNNL
jgi:hypothetical protein